MKPTLDYSAGFPVKRRRCPTCIYRKDLAWNLAKLEDDVRDKHIGFAGFRICHDGNDACCRGFWDHHRDEFAAGQIAQRLNLICWKP